MRDDSALLARRDGLGRRAALGVTPGLDLDEDEAAAVARDDVNFSSAGAVAGGNDCVPALLEGRAREGFAEGTEGDVRGGVHDEARSAIGTPLATMREALADLRRASRRRDCAQRRAATSPIALSRIPSALSACALVITSDGDRRMAFLPAPRTSRPL